MLGLTVAITTCINPLMLVVTELHRGAVSGQRGESDDVREVDGRLIVALRLDDFAGLQLLRHRSTREHPTSTLEQSTLNSNCYLTHLCQIRIFTHVYSITHLASAFLVAYF